MRDVNTYDDQHKRVLAAAAVRKPRRFLDSHCKKLFWQKYVNLVFPQKFTVIKTILPIVFASKFVRHWHRRLDSDLAPIADEGSKQADNWSKTRHGGWSRGLEGQPLAQHDVSHLLKLNQGLLVLGQDVVGIGGANLVAQVPGRGTILVRNKSAVLEASGKPARG